MERKQALSAREVVQCQICQNYNFELSQGSAATHRRCGGKYYMGCVGKLVLFPVVKNFEITLRTDKVTL